MSLEVSSKLRAVAHPLRLQMLSLLTGTEMSAAEVARELGTTQANASYHLRVLAAAGHLVDAGQEKIRGGVAKRYRHPWRDGTVRSEDTPRAADDGRMYVEALCQELIRRRSYAGGGPGSSTDAEMWVTPEVWRQVLNLSAEAAVLIHDQARPPRTEGTIHVNLTAVAFTMHGPGAEPPVGVEDHGAAVDWPAPSDEGGIR